MKLRPLLPLLLCLLLAACGAPTVGDVGVSQTFFAMDTVMSFTLLDGTEDDLTAAVVEVEALDAMLDRTRTDSALSRVNDAAGSGVLTAVPDEVYDAVARALALAERTGGAFDPTVAPLMDLWGFGTDHPARPGEDALEEALAAVGWQNASCVTTEEGGGVLLAGAGMALDLGGIGKGYAAGRVSELLRQRGVTSALLSLGGSVTALGGKQDGSDWQIAVQDPQNSDSYLGLLPLRDRSVSTSGGYERYFEEDGVRYHHILDPSTGLSADSGLLSATVVCSDPAAADALSTALFVLGRDNALNLWRASEDLECILVCSDGTVLVTEGLADTFDFWGGDHGYTVETVRR